MTSAPAINAATQALSLPEELILMLLNEETGYFHQVPGWHMNCAVIGAVLAELSITNRIDTDLESLFVLNAAETGSPILDPILKEIAAEPTRRNANYWIERLAHRAEDIVDLTLARLVALRILEHHDGDYWTLAHTAWQSELFNQREEGSVGQFVKTRIVMAIFNDEIPDPRDALIISLVDTCDVFRFIFQLDDETEERIRFICNMSLIGRSIAGAVTHNINVAMFRRSSLAKRIPTAPLRELLFKRHVWQGNIPAVFAELTEKYGPVFMLNPPFKKPMIFLAGPEVNHWAHRNGRLYLRTKDYFSDFEKIYGASGVLPSLDGADHFRLRKALQPGYSRGRLAGQLDRLIHYARNYMGDLKVGEAYQATRLCRRMINAQLSPMFVNVDSQDIFDDLTTYKERALNTHILKALPKFMLKTPGMRRRAGAVDVLLDRVQSVHTPAQRAGCPRGLADDLLSLHASDPQLVPESNLRFALSAALIASVYLGDAFSFAVYAMASQPELYARIQQEADALFDDGDPDGDDFSLDKIDVTHRFLMECLRMYPIVPVSIRTVMNSCSFDGYELPVGAQLYFAQSASHYLPEVFPEPFKFDIDRYTEPRNEHRSPGYAPYGLGTHTCLGSQWMELQLAANVLLMAHHFNIKVHPENYKLKFKPLPSPKPNKKLKFLISERRREMVG